MHLAWSTKELISRADPRRGSAVGSAGIVDVKLALGTVYDIGGIGDLSHVGDLEQQEALAAAQTAIRRGGI